MRAEYLKAKVQVDQYIEKHSQSPTETLLIRYIRHIWECEGITFIDSASYLDTLSKDDIQELKRLETFAIYESEKS